MSSRSPVWFNLLLVCSLVLGLAPTPQIAHSAAARSADQHIQVHTETPPVTTEDAGAFDSPLPTPTPAPTPAPWLGDILPSDVVTGTLTPEGGRLDFAGGLVSVVAPPGAVDEAVEVTLSFSADEALTSTLRFELEPDLTFFRPVTLTLRVGDRLDLAPQLDAWPYLAYLDEATGEWMRVPARADAQAGTLTAIVEHFSAWETGMDRQVDSGWRLTYNAPQVSLFSGAATFGYPIEVLPGRGGLQPGLALSYNSRGVDGILSWVQSDWAGLGWSIGGVEIARKVGRDGDSNGYSNDFSLLMNGSSYKLIKDSTSGQPVAYGRYHTQPFSALYVERCNDLSDSSVCYEDSAPNTTGEYWIVRAPDGITYTLGLTADAEQVVGDMFWWSGQYFHPNDPNDPGFAGRANAVAASRWRVNLVEDTFGNQMEYLYVEGNQVYYWDGAGLLQSKTKGYDAASYLSEVRYNWRSVGGGEYDRVVFERAVRPELSSPGVRGDLSAGTEGDADAVLFWQTTYLKHIKVLRGNTLVRQYELDYDLVWVDIGQYGSAASLYATRLLKRITPYGLNGAAALPATSFGYVFNEDATHKYGNKHACSNSCPPENQEWYRNYFPYHRLAWVENGYGGCTEFTYTRDRSDAQGHERPYSYIVSEARTLDGMGHTARTVYTYATGCWDRPGEACASWNGQYDWTLVGFQNVSEAAHDYDDALLSTVEHTFRADSWAFAGREEHTYTRDAAGNTLQQVDQAWDSETVGSSTFVYLEESTATVWQGGQAKSQRREYFYNPDDQSSDHTQYGNLTLTKEYDENGALYRMHKTKYAPNTTAWIVNKPSWSAVFDPDWQVLAASYYLYDDHTEWHNGPGDTGKLTTSRVRVQPDPTPQDGQTEYTIDTSFGYDAYGNLTSQTTYADYGRIEYNSVEGKWYNEQIGGGAARTSSTSYDTTYHLYPLQACNALNQCSTTEYYGVNGVAADYGLPGQVRRTWDANGEATATRYTYDQWGRLRQVIRPGDDLDHPTLSYDYWDDPTLAGGVLFLSPLLIGISYKDNLQQGVRQFYDGLGRLVQTQQANANIQGQAEQRDVLVSSGYDGLGRQTWQSVPYDTPKYVWNGQSPYQPYTPGSQPETHTAYDALGRAVRVLNPDGTSASTVYDGRWTTGVDANGHYRFSVTDEFGRLERVDETLTTLEEPFDSKNTTLWTWSNYQTVPFSDGGNNVVKSTGQGNWNAHFYHTLYNITGGLQGQGVKVEFKVDGTDTNAHFSLEASGSPYRRIDVIAAGNKIYTKYTTDGSNWTSTDLINPLQVGVWYVATLKTTTSGWSYVEVWQKDDPSQRGGYLFQMPAGLSYRFHHWIWQGNAWLDNYHELDYYTTTYTYNLLDQLTGVSDALGNQTTMTYDALGRKLTMDDPDMGDWYYQYDPAGNLTGQIDARRQMVSLSYDPLARLTGKLSPDSVTTSMYDPFDSKDTSAWTWSAYQTVPFSDGGNNVVKSVGTGSNWNASFYRSAYSLTSGEGVQLRFKVSANETKAHFSIEANDTTYRRFGVIADQSKLRVQYTIDGSNYIYPSDLLPSLATNTWYVLQIGLDDYGCFTLQVYKESDPTVRGFYQLQVPDAVDGKSWRFHHWVYRDIAYLDDYREFSGPTYRYDQGTNGKGYRTAMSDPSGSASWTYDTRGRMTQETKVINGAGGGTFVTQWGYDAMDRPAWIKYPGGNGGQIGEQVSYGYTAQGLLKSVAGTNTYVGDTTYDAAGRVDLRKLGSAASPVLQTDYIYYAWTDVNGLGRLKWIKTGPSSPFEGLQKLKYTYDAAGNVQTVNDYNVGTPENPQTQTQDFDYDALDRLTNANVTGGDDGQGQYSESYAYNAIGNLTSKGGASYTYPASGASSVQPHAVRRVTGSGGNSKTVQIRAYSTPCNDGVRATMELWVNGVKKETWTNVAASWTTHSKNVTLSGNDQIEVVFTNDCNAGGYDRNLYVDYVVVDGRTVQAEGGAAVIDKGGGSAAFNGLDVIAGQQNIYWNAALRFVVGAQAYAACYDQNGNMTCRVRDGAAYLLSYDAENRLTQATHLPSNQTTSFTYDGDGGRVKEVGYENLAAGVNATSDATLNWPGVATNGDTWADSGTGSSGEYAYTSQTGLHYVQLDLGAVYTVDKVKVWHYAADGRTYHATKTQVSENGSAWTTVFDSATSGEYPETAAGKTHTFTARNVRYVRDYLNGSTSNAGNHWVEIEVWGTRTTAYVGAHYERDGASGVATSTYYAGSARVALRRGSVVYYLLSDHLGSTALTADSSGNEVSELRYRAWGETRYAGGSGTPTDRRFTGQQQEAALGLYFYNARYYDAYLNRWIQPDTIVPQPENPQSLNRFSYVLNNPLKFNDPSGHCAGAPENHDPDDPCWDAYYEAMGTLGGGFEFLAQWNFLELSDLLKWLGRGFNFTGAWTSQGMADVRTALGWIENAMPDGWDTMKKVFGLFGSSTVTFAICPGCHGGPHVAFGWERRIDFDQGNPGIMSILHETGHIVDRWLGLLTETTTGGWSQYGLIGVGWNWHKLGPFHLKFLQPYYDDRKQDAPHSQWSPSEDFADTFAAFVVSQNDKSLFQSWTKQDWREPSDRRWEALITAFESVR